MSGRNQRKRGGKKQSNAPQKSQGKGKGSKKKDVDPKILWGDVEALPKLEGFPISTPDPVAVVTSLGQPPLPGHGPASPHYFKLVYGRATQLAGALAMAGQIDDLTPEPLPEPELEPEDEPLTEVGDEGNLVEASADEEE